MKNILFKLVSIIVIMSILTVPIYADSEKETITDITEKKIIDIEQPKYSNIGSIKVGFGISNIGKASGYTEMSTYDVDYTKVYTYFQKFENGHWTTVKYWSDIDYDDHVLVSHSYYVMSGYQYRMYVRAYLYDNGHMVEGVTAESPKDYY